jgi:hypothetical protein
VAAAHEGIPRDLLHPQPGMPVELWLPQLVQRLEDTRAISAEAARWAVAAWAEALGVTLPDLGASDRPESPVPEVKPRGSLRSRGAGAGIARAGIARAGA